LVKQVLDVDQIKAGANGALRTEGVPLKISNYDKNGVEAAVRLREKNPGSEVVALATMKVLVTSRERIESSVGAALRVIAAAPPRVILFDNSLGAVVAHGFLQALRTLSPASRVIITSTVANSAILTPDVVVCGRWDVLIAAYAVDEIVNRVERDLAGRGVAPSAPSRFTAHVRDAIRYVSRHYREPSIVHKTSAGVGLSTRHLEYLFGRDTGIPLKTFTMRLRIELAAGLLRETHEKLETIAVEVGFSDAPHLSRVFKQYTSDTPGAYRRRLPYGRVSDTAGV
jgi:AraC-like DNA-binding protein